VLIKQVINKKIKKMKKIVLLILVAMVPLLTMAQKKAKKKKNVKTEINEGLNASYEFMVITGYEFLNDQEVNRSVNSPAASKNNLIRPFSKVVIKFDFGRVKANQASNLLENSSSYKTMATAVNAAAKEGWNFVSSDVVAERKSKTHYYYMRRNK
jgi:glucan phosphoethanolaminetransferase (alkaline phosphatase superfamily)